MPYMGHNRHHFNGLTIIPILIIGTVSFFLFSSIAFAACIVQPVTSGQASSASYVASLKSCIDAQYVSCQVAEPAGLWGNFATEVQSGQIIRAAHIALMQNAIKQLKLISPQSLPAASSISFTDDFTGASSGVGSVVRAVDLNDIITNINKFQCPLCAAVALPLNSTTANFPTTGETYTAVGVCTAGVGGSATATCGANGAWGPASGTCCAANQTWFGGGCCALTTACALNGSCAATSEGCGLSGTCADAGFTGCQGGQYCNGAQCVCPGGEVLYNGSCCAPSALPLFCGINGACGVGTGNVLTCGGPCTCPPWQICLSTTQVCTTPVFAVTTTPAGNATNDPGPTTWCSWAGSPDQPIFAATAVGAGCGNNPGVPDSPCAVVFGNYTPFNVADDQDCQNPPGNPFNTTKVSCVGTSATPTFTNDESAVNACLVGMTRARIVGPVGCGNPGTPDSRCAAVVW